ncbi:MAG: YhjD/YihY/BrkB family envelope integrity protein [Prosthecobacter sp.]|uniref:YhjD/YihY/BrkB family envelope integrity protein n=1 Tax=Prosthecobacter sp. TaxID=1965333 RepID=UPI003BB0B3AE
MPCTSPLCWLLPPSSIGCSLSRSFKTLPRFSNLGPCHGGELHSEVAFAAFLTTILLQVCRRLFEHYVYDLSNFNTVYGAFAVVIVLLMWIYLSGVIIMYGGCLCAAQDSVSGISRRRSGKRGRRILGHWSRRRK